MKNPSIYLHHAIACAPRSYAAVARSLAGIDWARHSGALYGAWRSQIGRPRDELTAITVWPGDADVALAQKQIGGIAEVHQVASELLHATLRPASPTPPQRQGNYAFRWFELPEQNWEEFLSLCTAAWPGFESTYDSQVIGLWRCVKDEPGRVRALLLTTPARSGHVGTLQDSGRRRRERNPQAALAPLRFMRQHVGAYDHPAHGHRPRRRRTLDLNQC